ncbi:dihydroorotase [compost metagenome]
MDNVLSKFLLLGYSLEEIIGMVTVNAAAWLGKPELGRIRVGDTANLTLFTLADGQVMLTDSEGEQRTANQIIQAKGVVANGEFIECEIRA